MSRRRLEAVSYAERRDETIYDTVGPELSVADSDGRTQVCRKLEREPEGVFKSHLAYESEEEIVVIIVMGCTECGTRTCIPCPVSSRSPIRLSEGKVVSTGSTETRLTSEQVETEVHFQEVRISEEVLITCLETITKSASDCLRLGGSSQCEAENGSNDNKCFFHNIQMLWAADRRSAALVQIFHCKNRGNTTL